MIVGKLGASVAGTRIVKAGVELVYKILPQVVGYFSFDDVIW